MQTVGLGHPIQLRKDRVIGGAAIVIGTPHGIRAQRKGGEKA